MSRAFADETGGHGGDLARAARLWNPADGKMLDFSSNINPLGPPPGLINILRKALPEIVSYPSPQARELREKLAQHLDVPIERLLLGNGANELIHLLLLWRRPRRVLVPAPSFSEYERAAVLAGAPVERYPLPPDGEFDGHALGRKIERGDLLVICNPNNPSGKLYRRSELLPLIREAVRRGAAVMIDESFIPLTGHPEESLRDLQSEQLWVVLSLTKIWALPGLRLGCAVGPVAEVAKISRWGDPWRVNNLAQKAGIYCIERKGFLEKTLALVEKERAFLSCRFQETGAFRVFEGAANFLLLQGLDPAFDVAVYQEYLARRGVLIRRADNFCGLDRRYFRISVRKRRENLRLLQETENFLKTMITAGAAGRTGGDYR
jgi:threonine-phosphate decarboxylase